MSSDILYDNSNAKYIDKYGVNVSDYFLYEESPALEHMHNIEPISLNGYKGEPIPHELHNSSGILLLFFIAFIFFSFSFRKGIEIMLTNKLAFFEDSSFVRKQLTMAEVFKSNALVGVGIFSLAIVIFETLDDVFKATSTLDVTFPIVLLIMLTLFLFIGLKLSMNRLLGWMFDVESMANVWNELFLMSFRLFSVLIFIPTLVLVFTHAFHHVIIISIYTLLALLLLVHSARIIFYFIRQSYDYLYMFMYFCAMEIIPYIFLAFSLVFVYEINIFNSIL